MLRFYLALWTAKASKLALKLTKHNATNFPGIVAIKLCPDFIEKIRKPETIIGVTGTNGKTTVTNMLVDMLRKDGKKILCNEMGSNIATGIATTFLNGVGLFGGSKYETAVLEIDERSAPKFFPFFQPELLIINNLTRDSIMRNAHPEYISRILTEEIPSETRLVINGDDLIASNVAPENDRVYFGIEKLEGDRKDCINLINDLQVCPKCGGLLEYDYLRYHHIGRAHCSKCDFRSPDCDYYATDVNIKDGEITISEKNGSGKYGLLNDSVFNIYNVVAVVACLREFGYSRERIAELLSQINIVKTRFNEEHIGDYVLIKQMAKEKNALGSTRAFEYIAGRPGDKEILLMMNCLGDEKTWSENMCWMYDCDFEFLNKENIKNIIVTGPRAKDYYLRLKIAGIPDDRIRLVRSELEAPQALKLEKGANVYLCFGTDSVWLANDVYKNIVKRMKEESKEGVE